MRSVAPINRALYGTTQNGGSRLKIAVIITWIVLLSSGRDSLAATPSPAVDAKIVAAAKEWFHRFETGDIDRSQLNAEVNQQVTAEGVPEGRRHAQGVRSTAQLPVSWRRAHQGHNGVLFSHPVSRG